MTGLPRVQSFLAGLALVLTAQVAWAQGPPSNEPPPSEKGFDALAPGGNPVVPGVGSASPFTPGVQNTPTRDNTLGGAFTPGVQNNPNDISGASPFAPGNQNQSSVWPGGGNNPWAPQNPGNSSGPPQQNYWGQNLPRPEDPQFMPLPPNFSNLPIRISMPPGEPGPCGYVLSTGQQSWNYTIAPGRAQTFIEDHVWQVTYDRGGGFGPQTYALRSAHYKFRQSPRGWELYRTPLDDVPAAPVAVEPPLPPSSNDGAAVAPLP